MKPDWVDFHPDPRTPRRKGRDLGLLVRVAVVCLVLLPCLAILGLVLAAQMLALLP